MDPRLCWCGHQADAHDHYRPGGDCGACGPARCRSYRPRLRVLVTLVSRAAAHRQPAPAAAPAVDAAEDARVLRNLLALTPYAIPELAPPFTPARRRQLAPLLGRRVWRGARLIPRPRRPEPTRKATR